MKRYIIACAITVLSAASAVLGSPTINIDAQYMLNTSRQRRIPIVVSSSPAEQVEGVLLAVQIGDGGSSNGGTDSAPQITNLDITGPGTIFNSSNTGQTTFYLNESNLPPSMIAQAETSTVLGTTVSANGVLGYLTVDPSGASVGSYQIHLDNVGGANNTMFNGDISPAYSGDFYIQIVNLHQSIWNAGSNGLWTNQTWTNPQPPYPNYTTQAVVNTPYTVNVASAQEADSLSISDGGKVAISASGGLTITNSVSLSTGGTLSIAPGYNLNASAIQLSGGTLAGSGTIDEQIALSGGTLDAPAAGDNLIFTSAVSGSGGLAKTGLGTATLSADASYSGTTTISGGKLQVNGSSSTLDALTGAGTLALGNGAAPSILTANSISVGTLTISAGSKLIISPISNSLSSTSLAPVPEPSTLILLTAALGMLWLGRKIK